MWAGCRKPRRYSAAIEIDPQNQSARNNLGLVLGETGRYDESLAEFRQAGGEAEAQANLAYCKTRAGDLQGAKSAYHRALSLNQELKPAAEALMQLAQQSPQPAPADPALSEPKRARVSRMQGNGADFLETIQPANPRPAQAEQAAWISATLPGSPGMEAGIREPSLPAREAAGQDASGFIPARVFRFSEGSQLTVTTEVHRRQTPPTDLYERLRPAVPGVASAANAGGTFTAPNLFGSPASTPTMHPWQAPTWTPDFGGVFAPGQPLPTTPEAGTVMPSVPPEPSAVRTRRQDPWSGPSTGRTGVLRVQTFHGLIDPFDHVRVRVSHIFGFHRIRLQVVQFPAAVCAGAYALPVIHASRLAEAAGVALPI